MEVSFYVAYFLEVADLKGRNLSAFGGSISDVGVAGVAGGNPSALALARLGGLGEILSPVAALLLLALVFVHRH
jgi:hypothetical protein